MDKAPDAFRTISEVADDLDVPQHVLRFWETRFPQIKPMKRGGGRRYYRPDDMDLLRGIRHLLYGEGYTIRGVQRLLKDNGVKFVQAVGRSGAPRAESPIPQDGEGVANHVSPQGEQRGPVATPAVTPRPNASPSEPSVQGSVAGKSEGAAAQELWPEEPPVPPTGTVASRSSDRAVGKPDAGTSDTLSRDNLRKLQATLYELGECRRLLNAALSDDEEPSVSDASTSR